MSQVRISNNTHSILRSLSALEGAPMQEILDRAVEHYRRKTFLAGLSDDFRRLSEDDESWTEYQGELAEWDPRVDADNAW